MPSAATGRKVPEVNIPQFGNERHRALQPPDSVDGHGIGLVALWGTMREDSAYRLPHLRCLKDTLCTETERTIGPSNTNAIGQHVPSVYCAVPLEERLAVAFPGGRCF